MIIRRTLSFMLMWVFAVFVIYPILHEGGHALAGILIGAEQISAGIIPQAFIRFSRNGISARELWFLSVGGMGIAPVFLLFYRTVFNFEKLIKLIIGTVCYLVSGLYFCISFLGAIGWKLPDDLSVLAENSGLDYRGSLLISFASAFLSLVIVVSQKPIETIKAFYRSKRLLLN